MSFGRNLAIPVTILLTLLTINAMNFIDGLDGLAAGVTVIAAGAFFVFSYHLTQDGYLTVASAPTLLAAALAGACLGFLPHNFWPARIFMGDSGSMVVGLMLSAAATTATTTADPQAFTGARSGRCRCCCRCSPIAVLALPFVDLLLAVVPPRPPRPLAVRAGQAAPAPPAARDRAQPPPGRAAAVLLVGAASPSPASGSPSKAAPWLVVLDAGRLSRRSGSLASVLRRPAGPDPMQEHPVPARSGS